MVKKLIASVSVLALIASSFAGCSSAAAKDDDNSALSALFTLSTTGQEKLSALQEMTALN